VRRAAKVDKNQGEVVSALVGIGVSVFPMHGVGGGFPDLLWWHRGVYGLIEVKEPSRRNHSHVLTPAQERFHSDWPGHIDICWSGEEAIEAVRAHSHAVS